MAKSKPTPTHSPSPSSPTSKATAQAAAASTRFLLGLICFCSGAGIMIIEISANRLLAPYFGNSIYTWTALIGVVLISLSIGSYVGGRLADKSSRGDLLGWLLTGASAFTFLIPIVGLFLGPRLANAGLIAGPVFISLFMFTIPGILLGAVSPACVRFYSLASGGGQVGASAGVISMLGSLGSFIGTFLSGFVLLSMFGVKTIFIGSGLTLALLAVVAFWMAGKLRQSLAKFTSAAVPGLVLCVLFANESVEAGVIHQENSFYHRIRVKEETMAGRPARTLYLDSTLEGGVFTEGSGLPLNYQNYWQLVRLPDDFQMKRALFIGAGAFGMPEQVSLWRDGVDVDVAEIDPAVVEVGRKFFRLNEHPRVQAHAVDGRRFLQTTPHQYDLIFGDAYNGIRHIPAHLVTKEFFTEIKGKLTPNGVYLMNLISSIEGRNAELLHAIHATLKTVFPNVEVFRTGGGKTDVQNIIILASTQSWEPWIRKKYHLPGSVEARLAEQYILPQQLPTAGPVLTDDFNTVDAIVARQLLQ